MELAEILAESAVLCCSDVKTKRQLFEILSQKASELTGIPVNDILAAIVGREELGSTGLGNGIAIPHGKIAGLDGVTALFARLPSPIDFDSVDDEPVDLVVMLLAPTGAGADHLKALSRVARLLRTDSIVDELRQIDDPAQLHTILTAPLADTVPA
ncbi:nitrogen regulatory protein [Devosia epidermidihirudinis]|uniref:Nitrogen regulatory protein n=1 Tax=Devosia epidermidihirudinis TaxID=1293439 RepID=A0A0F5QA91_9HYPH|nr:PTS sugar transporter subunit IIA [Devosia epidermidihirudinis]KKC37885.1 nitrogen regulatory protein [Devosia epidermidihirudinis]